MHPPFSLLAAKKTGRARSKRNRFYVAKPAARLGCLFAACGSCWLEVPTESISLLPGALDRFPRRTVPPHFEVRVLVRVVEERSVLLVSLSLSRCWWGEFLGSFLSRGMKSRIRGPAGPLGLAVLRGCGGNFGIPPRFWRGLGRCLCAKDISPSIPAPGSGANYPINGVKQKQKCWHFRRFGLK